MEWRLGGDLLENGEKYQIKQRDSVLELTIRDAVPEDSGVYTCVCREQKTKATVKVIGMFNVWDLCGEATLLHNLLFLLLFIETFS